MRKRIKQKILEVIEMEEENALKLLQGEPETLETEFDLLEVQKELKPDQGDNLDNIKKQGNIITAQLLKV